MNVLIVDDSVMLRERLAALLGGIEGVEVVGAEADAEGAIASFGRLTRGGGAPDVVILDLQLARGHGIEVLKAIRAQGAPTRVLVLTNYPYAQYRRLCASEGADFFLDKSMEFDQVGTLLRGMKRA